MSFDTESQPKASRKPAESHSGIQPRTQLVSSLLPCLTSCFLSTRTFPGLDGAGIILTPATAPNANHSSPRNPQRLGQPSSSWKPWPLPRPLLKHFPKDQRSVLDPRKLQLHIKLLTFGRPASLTRFLKSLNNVDFLGETVSLQVREVAPATLATPQGPPRVCPAFERSSSSGRP